MYGKMQESGLPEIIRLMSISAIWDQHPVIWFFTCFAPPHSGEWWQTGLPDHRHWLFMAWAACGFGNPHLEGQNSWWLGHPCLLLWQERLHLIGLTCGDRLWPHSQQLGPSASCSGILAASLWVHYNPMASTSVFNSLWVFRSVSTFKVLSDFNFCV